MVPKGKRGSKTQRHGGRVVLSLDVERSVRDALRERASHAGVSMAEFLRNAIAEPEKLYMTNAAQIARPMTAISYHVNRALAALADGAVGEAMSQLEAARRAMAEFLRPLERAHSDEIHERDRRRAGGWTG